MSEPGSEPLDDQLSEENLRWLVNRAREHARKAQSRHRQHEAQVVLTFDRHGRVHVRFRPEERPERSEPEPDEPEEVKP